MEERRKHLLKLKLNELKAMAGLTGLKKKPDLVELILRKEFPIAEEEIKRVKIAPVFAMAKTTKPLNREEGPICLLCDGQETVWSELGLALCPACTSCLSTACVIPSPSIKQEKGVTTVKYTYDAQGRIVFNIGTVDREKICQLVLGFGFGICESIEALFEAKSVEDATQLLISKTRNSAENSSIAEAQLNSEQARDDIRESKKLSAKHARSTVTEDLTVLLDIDNKFCARFLFADNHPDDEGKLLRWVLENDSNRVLLFDYLTLKCDSIKWYKQAAAKFFESLENGELAHSMTGEITDILVDAMRKVREATFSIPKTGGSLPVLFRNHQNESLDPDDLSDVVVISDDSKDKPTGTRDVVVLD